MEYQNNLYGEKAKKKRQIQIPKIKAAGIALIILAGVTGYNTMLLRGIGGGIPFAGTSLFSITPSFALGSNPAGAQITPGSTLNYTLTVQSIISGRTLVLSFNSSDTTDWTASKRPSTGCGADFFQGDLTMKIQGQSPVVPINYNGPAAGCGGDVSAEQTVSVPLAKGVNTYTGSISVQATASSSISFSLNFFGQVV